MVENTRAGPPIFQFSDTVEDVLLSEIFDFSLNAVRAAPEVRRITAVQPDESCIPVFHSENMNAPVREFKINCPPVERG